MDTPVSPFHDRRIARSRERFVERTPTSAQRHSWASRVLPGGETRTVTHFRPYPLEIVAARGQRLVDADGNGYLDLLNNYTSLVHGNAHPAIVDALSTAVREGTVLASTHHAQVELAEAICARVASVQRVRFTNSGSEANALALRIARRVTGRRKAVVFEGSYHGSMPLLTGDDPETIVVPFNDESALRQAVTDDVAAVFSEPFLGAGGVLHPDEGFLSAAESIARHGGALFVLDEVQSLRNGYGGHQASLNLHPDLTTMGKIIGGGMAIGAVGGAVETMSVTAADATDPLAHSGTFNGQLLAARAGAVALRMLSAEAITELNARAAAFADRVATAARAAGVPVVLTRAGSILQVHLTATEPRTAEQVRRPDQRDVAALHLELLNQGVYTSPRGMVNLSTVLTEADLRTVVEAYSAAFNALV